MSPLLVCYVLSSKAAVFYKIKKDEYRSIVRNTLLKKTTEIFMTTFYEMTPTTHFWNFWIVHVMFRVIFMKQTGVIGPLLNVLFLLINVFQE